MDRRGSEIDVTPIAGLLDGIEQTWHPVAIWLFGSRARGEATPDSDWDLLVIAPDTATDVDDPMIGWRLQKAAGVCADVIACRASAFEAARNTPNTLAYEASQFGVLVYERVAHEDLRSPKSGRIVPRVTH